MATCRWVLVPAVSGQDPVYCNRAVGYIFPIDEDGSRYRKYRTWCEEHQKKADEEPDDWSS